MRYISEFRAIQIQWWREILEKQFKSSADLIQTNRSQSVSPSELSRKQRDGTAFTQGQLPEREVNMASNEPGSRQLGRCLQNLEPTPQ
ncbi:hypothetical protein HALLA_03215 (plasmid) [Halostagnicola larsenii XH-48]|uniref:Uncharacterized protein n=1 Tax=Halostagnicola larsenii XH-48 TaxID=797299 RepID=W0JVZ2_9EURY|nr:hypothetical protein HALLA_03215 [Halostagnicola larsenii XH-48]